MFFITWTTCFVLLLGQCQAVPAGPPTERRPMDVAKDTDKTPTWIKTEKVDEILNLDQVGKKAAAYFNWIDELDERRKACDTKQTNTCLVATLFVPNYSGESPGPGGTIYSSTIPRLDYNHDILAQGRAGKAPVWFNLAKNYISGSNSPFHAEDGTYWLYESSEDNPNKEIWEGTYDASQGAAWAGKAYKRYPQGSVIAVYGSKGGGKADNVRPCKEPHDRPRQPECKLIADRLGVTYEGQEPDRTPPVITRSHGLVNAPPQPSTAPDSPRNEDDPMETGSGGSFSDGGLDDQDMVDAEGNLVNPPQPSTTPDSPGSSSGSYGDLDDQDMLDCESQGGVWVPNP